METLYRKVAVSEPSQFEHNKHYYFVDFDGNIQRDCFFNYASFDEYTHRYKYFLVEIPDSTAQLQADKAELLEALEIFFPMFTELDSEFGIENPHPRKWTETETATVQKLFDLIQKHT